MPLLTDVRAAQHFSHAGGNHRRAIADGDDAVDRPRPDRVQDLRDGGVLLVKPDRNRPVAPGISQDVTAVGRVDQIDAEMRGGVFEGAGLITRGSREQE